ncbi:flavodoxin [Paraferrimonas sedimenticola]|uniref:Flavodoxin n=1 Tax=Paraferrimonas sedimenticola TaxID=375674 RepID=A0AA37RWK7_9GAMM|nr:flavodoxin [Paraferrimonas sedimenticola]GLP96726.1 flavodoxin [Paraferrimonas sedimenticola]
MKRVTLVYGTVYGAAESVAEALEAELSSQDIPCRLIEEPNFDDIAGLKADQDRLVLVTSTTGEGDIPDNIMPLFDELRTRFPLLGGLEFAVVALGDSSYGDTYCGAGRQWQALLEELQGEAFSEMLKIDACETMDPEQDAIDWWQSLTKAAA